MRSVLNSGDLERFLEVVGGIRWGVGYLEFGDVCSLERIVFCVFLGDS